MPKPNQTSHTKKIHKQVTGVWMECIVCHQHLPCHPYLEMCGTCTFGEADAMMEFDGTWEEVEDA